MTSYSKSRKNRFFKFKPNLWDIGIFILLMSFFIVLSQGWREILSSLTSLKDVQVSLDPLMLPDYALRSSLRMFIAMGFSLLFTFIYGTIAAKTVLGERFFIPLLDILQSVPILGFLSFIIVVFMRLFPGQMLGMECAAIFAIFTSQAWNMTYSFYQSLRAIPPELSEVSTSFNLTGWQRFWQLEVPFAIPQLLWNAIMSMSAGWFFVVASEAISIGNTTVKLPGIGSYLAIAIDNQDLTAIGWAMLTMLLVIVGYDQLIFRPLTVWAHKFKVETITDQPPPKSWLIQTMRSTHLFKTFLRPFTLLFYTLSHLPLRIPKAVKPLGASSHANVGMRLAGWIGFLGLILYGVYYLVNFLLYELSLWEILDVSLYGLATMARVILMVIICTIIWVPIGVWIGLRPSLTHVIQPILQYLAAFPANLVFPLAVIPIIHFNLNPNIWLSILMIMASQWYILLNVIAGAHALPYDLRELANSFHIHGWLKWHKLILPSIFPYYVTGIITASGAAWNASIIAEVASWGDHKLSAVGIGAYISKATVAGDYPRIILSIAIMSIYIVFLNRFFWRPVINIATRRFSLD